jgi:hypothetical protein
VTPTGEVSDDEPVSLEQARTILRSTWRTLHALRAGLPAAGQKTLGNGLVVTLYRLGDVRAALARHREEADRKRSAGRKGQGYAAFNPWIRRRQRGQQQSGG